MASSADAYAAARRLVDEAHAADPKGEELHYADGVERWAAALAARPFYAALAAAEAPELLALAARCQHLERFATPRDSFPEGKAGYLKWRRSLYVLQGDRARELLRQVGVAERECDAVRTWVSKTDLQPGKESGELGTQLLEDAAVLVFLQEQLASFAAQHGEYPRRKFVDILRKTWRKLSPAGRDAVAGLDFPEALAGIIAEATEGETQGSAGGEPAAALPAAKEQTLATALADVHLADNAAASTSEVQPQAFHRTEPTEADKGGRTFGSRYLGDEDDMWQHNAWDHAKPPPEHVAMVEGLLAKQRETRVSQEDADKYHASAASYWDTFYSSHDNRFFKDRHWLHHEFPELVATTAADRGPCAVLEVGCGAGNTVFPLLEMNQNPHLRLFACDYSSEAVRVVKSNPLYESPPVGSLTSSVWDLSSTSPPVSADMPFAETAAKLPEGIEPHSLDIVVLIFVLSALHPREWEAAVRNVRTALKPGGMVLLRDYGRHDLPQLRFRKGRLLDENFYVRGDGTRVYFFTPDELQGMFRATPPSITADDGDASTPAEPVDETQYDFKTLQLATDRRLLLNRKERKSMWRVWNQVKLQSLYSEPAAQAQ